MSTGTATSNATRRTNATGSDLASGTISSAGASTRAPAPSPRAATTPSATGYQPLGTWKLLALVNDHRRARRLPALTVDPAMAARARRWSETMARTGRLAHDDGLFAPVTRAALRMRLLGENVGWDWSVAEQHAALLASPGHRHNIEHPRFRSAGFAVVRDAQGRLWSTQEFGLPRG